MRTHGIESTYTSGCRCLPCSTAGVKAMTQRRRRRFLKPTPDHVHGTLNGYRNHGCRCDDCKRVHRENIARFRASKKDGKP